MIHVEIDGPPRAPATATATAEGDDTARHDFPAGGLVALARDAYASAPLVSEQIRPGVWVCLGAGGNVTAVSGADGCTVIDTGYGPRTAEIRQRIAGALGQPPQWLIDTHWHFDHTDGNAGFAAAGATIVAHANCRARLSSTQHVPSLDWRVSASPRRAWPTLTFDRPFTLDIGHESLRLLPQDPAHTDGDVAVLLASANILVTGDLFVHEGYPVIDESSRGTLRGMIEAVDGLLAVTDAGTAVVPGHGVVTDRRGLTAFLDMLRRVEDRIEAMTAAGFGPEEIIAARPTAELDPLWGRGYVTGTSFVRMALAAMKPSDFRH